MVQMITDNSASIYSYLPSENRNVTAKKCTRLDEDGKPLLAQSVQSITNTEKITQIINDIETLKDDLDIRIFSPDNNMYSLSVQIANLETQSRSSKSRNASEIFSNEEIIQLGKNQIKNNNEMMDDIEKIDKPFIRVKNGKAKGYEKGFFHALKMVTSGKYRRSVQYGENLAGIPTANNIREGLLNQNNSNNTIISAGENNLKTLEEKRNLHNQLLQKLDDAKKSLANLPEEDRAIYTGGLTDAQRDKMADLLVELTQYRNESSESAVSETPAMQQTQHLESVAKNQRPAIKPKKRAAPPAPDLPRAKE